MLFRPRGGQIYRQKLQIDADRLAHALKEYASPSLTILFMFRMLDYTNAVNVSVFVDLLVTLCQFYASASTSFASLKVNIFYCIFS